MWNTALAALNRKQRLRPGHQKFDGEKEAHLIALACSTPPKGQKRWTLQLLADKMVELDHFDSISSETIRQHLKKNEFKLWLNKQWCIPPEANAEFVWAMEDILEVYHRPSTPENPLVCMDESSKQQVIETRQPIESKSGQVERYDYEYERDGVSNLSLCYSPHLRAGVMSK